MISKCTTGSAMVSPFCAGQRLRRPDSTDGTAAADSPAGRGAARFAPDLEVRDEATPAAHRVLRGGRGPRRHPAVAVAGDLVAVLDATGQEDEAAVGQVEPVRAAPEGQVALQ